MDDPPAGPKPCCVCAAAGGKHCTSCKSRHYCSKACQRRDWYEGGHKAQCRQLAVEFQDRMLDVLMPAKAKANVAAVNCVSKAVAPAASRPTAKAEAGASADTTVWRAGDCAVCLDALPAMYAMFYPCCCKSICAPCSKKCEAVDKRCPLCRKMASPNHAESVRRLQSCADAGDLDGQATLASVHLHGQLGLLRNVVEAKRLFESAAAQGHARAMAELGQCYEHGGGGLEIDHAVALMWYRRAASKGYPVAQYSIGHAYFVGHGVEKSYAEAVEWYKLAAAQGLKEALFNLGVCYESGFGVTQNFFDAMDYFKFAQSQGHPGAGVAIATTLRNLGACHANGTGHATGKRDYLEALRLFELAAARGNLDATWQISRLQKYFKANPNKTACELAAMDERIEARKAAAALRGEDVEPSVGDVDP